MHCTLLYKATVSYFTELLDYTVPTHWPEMYMYFTIRHRPELYTTVKVLIFPPVTPHPPWSANVLKSQNQISIQNTAHLIKRENTFISISDYI